VLYFEFPRQAGYREAVSQHLPFRFTYSTLSIQSRTYHFLAFGGGGSTASLLCADVALQALLGISRYGHVGQSALLAALVASKRELRHSLVELEATRQA
jgi:hypothetical protein